MKHTRSNLIRASHDLTPVAPFSEQPAHLDAQYDGQLATNASTTYSETSTDGVYAQT